MHQRVHVDSDLDAFAGAGMSRKAGPVPVHLFKYNELQLSHTMIFIDRMMTINI